MLLQAMMHWIGTTTLIIKSARHSSDTANNIFYNEVLGKYQIICRGAHVDRRIVTLFLRRFDKLDRSTGYIVPNPFDIDFTQYYGMTVYPDKGYFLGFLQLYYTDEDDTVWTKDGRKS